MNILYPQANFRYLMQWFPDMFYVICLWPLFVLPPLGVVSYSKDKRMPWIFTCSTALHNGRWYLVNEISLFGLCITLAVCLRWCCQDFPLIEVGHLRHFLLLPILVEDRLIPGWISWFRLSWPASLLVFTGLMTVAHNYDKVPAMFPQLQTR